MFMAPRLKSASNAEGLRPVAAIRDVLHQFEAGESVDFSDRQLATSLRTLEMRARDLRLRGGLLATVRLSQEARSLQAMLDT